jgi:hypothetical protein
MLQNKKPVSALGGGQVGQVRLFSRIYWGQCAPRARKLISNRRVMEFKDFTLFGRQAPVALYWGSRESASTANLPVLLNANTAMHPHPLEQGASA